MRLPPIHHSVLSAWLRSLHLGTRCSVSVAQISSENEKDTRPDGPAKCSFVLCLEDKGSLLAPRTEVPTASKDYLPVITQVSALMTLVIAPVGGLSFIRVGRGVVCLVCSRTTK